MNTFSLWIIWGGHSYLFWITLRKNKIHLPFELNVYVYQNDTELTLVISTDASEEQHFPFKYVLSALIWCLVLIPSPLLFPLSFLFLILGSELCCPAFALWFYINIFFLSCILICLNPMEVLWEPWYHKNLSKFNNRKPSEEKT